MDKQQITGERIMELRAKGYVVEHLGDIWGVEYIERYRWVNDALDRFQENVHMTYRSVDAWMDADADDRG